MCTDARRNPTRRRARGGLRRGAARIAIVGALLPALGCHTDLQTRSHHPDAGTGTAAGDPGDAGSDAGQHRAPAVARAGDPCSATGARACSGPDSKLPLSCNAGEWQPESPCDDDERCDTADGRDRGMCKPIIAACENRQPDAPFCAGDAVRTCPSRLMQVDAPCPNGETCSDESGPECVPKDDLCAGYVPGRPFCAGDTVRWCPDETAFEQTPCRPPLVCEDIGAVGRCACQGAADDLDGFCAPGAAVVASWSLPPRELIWDRGELFWYGDRDLAVLRVSEAGGEPVAVHENDCGPLYGFALDATRLYAGTCGQQVLISRPRAAGPAETIVDRGEITISALDVARLGSALYFVHCGPGLVRVPARGGERTSFDLGMDCAIHVDVSGDRLIVQGGSDEPVISVNADGGDMVGLGLGSVVATDFAHVFLGLHACGDPDACFGSYREIVAVVPDGSEAARVVQPSSPSHSLSAAASDGRFLYVVEINDMDPPVGSLFRVPVGGGTKNQLATGLVRPGPIAVGGGSVFFWTGSEPATLQRMSTGPAD
jgi:hypothetical protein